MTTNVNFKDSKTSLCVDQIQDFLVLQKIDMKTLIFERWLVYFSDVISPKTLSIENTSCTAYLTTPCLQVEVKNESG